MDPCLLGMQAQGRAHGLQDDTWRSTAKCVPFFDLRAAKAELRDLRAQQPCHHAHPVPLKRRPYRVVRPSQRTCLTSEVQTCNRLAQLILLRSPNQRCRGVMLQCPPALLDPSASTHHICCSCLTVWEQDSHATGGGPSRLSLDLARLVPARHASFIKHLTPLDQALGCR